MSPSKLRLIAQLVAAFLVMGWLETASAQEVAIAPRFEGAGNFHHGVAAAKENGLWGLIDKKGEWVIRPKYDGITVGGDGLFGVQSGGRWGYIDAKGTEVIGIKYEAAGAFDAGVAPVKLNGLWGYITTGGATDVPIDYPELGGREKNLFTARTSDGWALVMKSISDGQWYPSSDPDVLRYYSVSEGAIVAKIKAGEMLLMQAGYKRSEIYLSIKRRSQGFSAASRSKDKWGYLDQDGEYIWADRFEEAGPFNENLAPVKTAGKWGYIDRAANFIVAPSYDAAFPFRDGLAVIRKGDLRGFLKNDPDRGIYEFIAPAYQDAYRFTEGLAPVQVGDKWGYVSSGRQPQIEDVGDVEPVE